MAQCPAAHCLFHMPQLGSRVKTFPVPSRSHQRLVPFTVDSWRPHGPGAAASSRAASGKSSQAVPLQAVCAAYQSPRLGRHLLCAGGGAPGSRACALSLFKLLFNKRNVPLRPTCTVAL
ncbi:protein KASH5-like [Platysternon megacephalum]|uniref:Protein KASH5-like n=1 Tax=Platysternon megacephalum TaxID=55544 RepID=A0A4D9DQY7_9SAUR|nr:protein KASH5-like [Platysternon megacephalum]